jgi:hypothetical protein
MNAPSKISQAIRAHHEQTIRNSPSIDQLNGSGITTHEALVASSLQDIRDIVCQWALLPLSHPDRDAEKLVRKVDERDDKALKAILGREKLSHHDQQQLKFMAEISRLRTPDPIGTYPSEDHVQDYADYAFDVAGAAQAHLTNICAGMPVSAVTELATIFTDALHDREPFAASVKSARDQSDCKAEIRADQSRMLAAE